MADKPFAREKALVLILIALIVMLQAADLRNADISFSAIVTMMLAFLLCIAGKHHVSR